MISAVCFIIGIKKLSHPNSARNVNGLAALVLLFAFVSTLYVGEVLDYKMIVKSFSYWVLH